MVVLLAMRGFTHILEGVNSDEIRTLRSRFQILSSSRIIQCLLKFVILCAAKRKLAFIHSYAIFIFCTVPLPEIARPPPHEPFNKL